MFTYNMVADHRVRYLLQEYLKLSEDGIARNKKYSENKEYQKYSENEELCSLWIEVIKDKSYYD